MSNYNQNKMLTLTNAQGIFSYCAKTIQIRQINQDSA